MTPHQIACNHFGCDAQPGEQCRERTDPGSTWIELYTFHQERVIDAASYPATGATYTPPVSAEAFGRAMLEDPDLPF